MNEVKKKEMKRELTSLLSFYSSSFFSLPFEMNEAE